MTTKYNCWKVISEDPDWTVWELDKSGWWLYRAEFNTHSEALAYADRMARTVEVVLPRLIENVLTTKQSRVYIHSNGGVSITKRAHYSHVGIPKADLKPLALALLAHHYRSAAP